jgi:hypothetical protein
MTGWLFEALMLLAFGVSWPASISKSLRTRFVRGKSPAFMMIVISGYACGIVHKLLNPPAADAGLLAKYVLWLYVMDLLLVSTDLTLYFLFRKNEAPRVA